MLLIQNKRVNWETHQIGIPGPTAKDKENRRIPFNLEGRLAAILKRRSKLSPDAYLFGTANGEYQPGLQTAWETLRLLAHDIEPRPTRKGAAWNREQLQRIDLRWHDLSRSQIGHSAVPEGLKVGCGACNQRYLQLWSGAA